uniref:Uncharacterized protein n=1 Tax=Pithovirus LCPAC401 TaxID=2506595 RepID=A0A481ZD30_9VIRU|nr:MAG: uncharacterized protein LCPAC401_02190 [Pithovirus LCPAC401]
MVRLVCFAIADPQILGMWYNLPKDALIFLNKKRSVLISRIGKESDKYKELIFKYDELKSSTDIFGYAYNVAGDYFIVDSEIRGLKWRTHPDLIFYVEETDQTMFKIIDIPEGKVFTEIKLHNAGFTMIVADGPAKFV